MGGRTDNAERHFPFRGKKFTPYSTHNRAPFFPRTVIQGTPRSYRAMLNYGYQASPYSTVSSRQNKIRRLPTKIFPKKSLSVYYRSVRPEWAGFSSDKQEFLRRLAAGEVEGEGEDREGGAAAGEGGIDIGERLFAGGGESRKPVSKSKKQLQILSPSCISFLGAQNCFCYWCTERHLF